MKNTRFLLGTLFVVGLIGCGSGSDSNNSPAGSNYSPATITASPISITSHNSDDVIYKVAESLFTSNPAEGFVDGFSSGFSGVVIQQDENSLANQVLTVKWLKAQVAKMQNKTDSFTGVKIVEDCYISGTLTMESNIEYELTNDSYMSMSFNECDDGDGGEMNGAIYFEISSINAYDEPSNMSVMFQDITFDIGPGVLFNIDGDMSITTTEANDIITTTAKSDQLTLAGYNGSSVFYSQTLKDFTSISTYSYYYGEDFSSFSGTIIDSELGGSVTITTTNSLNVNQDDLSYYTPTQGVIEIKGDDSTIKISVNDYNVTLDSDYDNDGVVDDTEIVFWSTLIDSDY